MVFSILLRRYLHIGPGPRMFQAIHFFRIRSLGLITTHQWTVYAENTWLTFYCVLYILTYIFSNFLLYLLCQQRDHMAFSLHCNKSTTIKCSGHNCILVRYPHFHLSLLYYRRYHVTLTFPCSNTTLTSKLEIIFYVCAQYTFSMSSKDV